MHPMYGFTQKFFNVFLFEGISFILFIAFIHSHKILYTSRNIHKRLSINKPEIKCCLYRHLDILKYYSQPHFVLGNKL